MDSIRTETLAEAMICAFSAVVGVLPPPARRSVNSILVTAVAEGHIGDADARRMVECLICPETEH